MSVPTTSPVDKTTNTPDLDGLIVSFHDIVRRMRTYLRDSGTESLAIA